VRAGSRRYLFPGLAIAAVAAVVIAGLFTVGSPADERMRRLDRRRVDDLVEITRKADAYWSKHSALPPSLDQLLKGPGTTIDGRDPVTGQAYGYAVFGGNSYEVCAEFERPTPEPLGPGTDRFWGHGAGRHCFRLEARAASVDADEILGRQHPPAVAGERAQLPPEHAPRQDE
jgi:hypothetical protein